jgi:TRAP-type mannitol/chloroaromatic compound transport system permease small subunit
LEALLRLSKLIDAFIERIGGLTTWIVLITITIGFYNVVARYIGRFIGLTLSSNFFIELQWYLFSVLFLLGFSYVLKRNQNVRVDFLYSKWNAKRRALVNLLGDLFFLVPFCIMGMVVAWNPVLRSWGRQSSGRWGTWEVSPDPGGLPRAPIKTMIIIGFALLLLQAISEIIKHVAVLRGAAKADSALAHAVEDYQPTPVE